MRATALGILALLFWSSTIAFSRSLVEALGILTASSYVFLLGGSIACVYTVVAPDGLRRLARLPAAYLIGCGGLFVAYMVSLYVAIGLASTRQQALKVGLVNYLWPGLTLAFAVPILRRRARSLLIVGLIIGFLGIFLATVQRADYSLSVLVENIEVNCHSYLLALAAAVMWALYSNLSRRWAGQAESGAVSIFLLVSGLILTGVRTCFPEEPRWTWQSMSELLYMAIFPGALAYTFWDEAMRKGRIVLVASMSYFTPLLSTIIGTAYLGVSIGWNLWAGCVLVVIGAAICKASVEEGARE